MYQCKLWIERQANTQLNTGINVRELPCTDPVLCPPRQPQSSAAPTAMNTPSAQHLVSKGTIPH